MGIEHPYLALVSFIIFASMIISLISVQLWVQYQLLRVPVFEGYAEYSTVNSTYATIKVVVRLVRGDPVEYQKVALETDAGTVMVQNSTTVRSSTITVTLEKFNGTLYTGQEGYVIISVTNPNALFTPGKEYDLYVFFNYGAVHARFSP